MPARYRSLNLEHPYRSLLFNVQNQREMDKQNQKTLVIFRDCHVRHNLVVKALTWADELMYRRMAAKRGWLVAVRKGGVI